MITAGLLSRTSRRSFVRSFVGCARNSPACDLGTGEVVQPQFKDPRLQNLVAMDPTVDDQPHPADSKHLVPPFFAHLGRRHTNEVGERALSEQFLLGRHRIGTAIPDERRLELLAGGRPQFPQELRRSWQPRVTSAQTPDPELAPHRRTSKNATEQAMSTIVVDARSRCSGG